MVVDVVGLHLDTEKSYVDEFIIGLLILRQKYGSTSIDADHDQVWFGNSIDSKTPFKLSEIRQLYRLG